MGRTTSKPDRKAKKSFTLSVESVAFLEEMRKRSSAQSASAILEEILQTVRREKKRASIERALTDYYDSLSDAEVEEEKRWGKFARRALSPEEKS